ncbi:MAG: class I SAM-dependent methyltransferase [Chloroflexi bacterium]|nr:class I SAM-dependent methyltransferase [Chloroflexota bacterium]
MEAWSSGASYESYVGRWSRLVARELLDWLAVPPRSYWLDVGCGTGVLSQTILDTAAPRQVTGVDFSRDYIAYARHHVADERVRFEIADAQALPFGEGIFDTIVSGLLLNFVPQPSLAVAEMARVARPGGVVAAYVWDYAGEMQLMRRFWDAAVSLDPKALDLDEGRRFPICDPEPLSSLFLAAGLEDVEVRAIEVPTVFESFDDYWSPFLGGQGPAPGYAMSLSEEHRAALRERIRSSLPVSRDDSIRLIARAWAVRGRR